MSDSLKDHTKSLQPYAAILVSHEERYHQLSGHKRDAAVAQIGEEITEEAAGNAAAVTSGAALHKVSLQLLLGPAIPSDTLLVNSKSSTGTPTTRLSPRRMKPLP